MGLSDERKRQIRAEEEAKLRAEREAEQEYRDQVRKELEAQEQAEFEQKYREEVREELTQSEPASEPQPVGPVSPPPAETTPRTAPLRPKRPSSLARIVAAVLILGGLASMGVAFSRGFALPFTGPREITLKVDEADELVALDDPVPVRTTSADTVSVTRATTEPESTPARGSATPTSPSPSTTRPTPSSTSSAKRATLRGSSVSVEAPSGWVVESSDFDDVLEIRWRGTGVVSGHEEVVAYLQVLRAALRSGEDVEDFAERLLEEFLDSTTPDQKIKLVDDKEIKDFHGVEALSIDVIAQGSFPYHMRNIYWIKGGKGYVLTCYATAGTFKDRAPAFERMLKSLRL